MSSEDISRSGWWRRASAGLGLVLFGLSLAWGACEVLVRFVLPVTTVEYQYDQQVGHLLAANGVFRFVARDFDVKVTTNSAGFHDVEHALKKPSNAFRVVVVGDSVVEALQVPIGVGFAHLLQERMQRWSQRPVEVINLGVSGNGPAQYYRLLEQRGMAYEPNLVLMAVTCINDFRNTLPELDGDPVKPYYALDGNGQLACIAPPDGVNRGLLKRTKLLLKHSAALRVVSSKIELLREERALGEAGSLGNWHAAAASNGQNLPITSDWNVFLSNPPSPWDKAYRMTLRMIEESKELAEHGGARFIVVVIAPKAVVEDRVGEALGKDVAAASLSWDTERPFHAIEQLGREKGFGVINLYPDFKSDYRQTGLSASWEHDGHWNPRGHLLAAEAVDNYLRSHAGKFLPSTAQGK